MASVSFRFYQELNDFLPTRQRQREIRLAFEPPTPVGHLIETLGVPHTEVELILIHGRSVALGHRLADADRVSVYPMFEALDVSPLLRIRERPLRTLRFLADAHLGKLAVYLRMLGFDTLYRSSGDDHELAAAAARDKRILLTRDRALLMHRQVTHGCYLRQLKPKRQLGYLVERLDLCSQMQPFSRCMRCNGKIVKVARTILEGLVPASVYARHQDYWRCTSCQRIYWQGSHYLQMREFVATLCSAVRRIAILGK